jgi:hypothetical protein
LGREKGYRLIGVHSLGFNAFFVRTGLVEGLLPERSCEEIFARTERLRDWGQSWFDLMLKNGQQWEEV